MRHRFRIRKASPTVTEPCAAAGGLSARAVMSAPAVTVRAQATIADAAHSVEHIHASVLAVVGFDGRATGLLSCERLEHPHADEYAALVGSVADADPDLMIDQHADPAALLDRPAFRYTGHAVVVDRSRRPVGIVSEKDVANAV